MNTKNLLLTFALFLSSLCAHAQSQPAAKKLDWSKPSAQKYSLAFDVAKVTSLEAAKSGYQITVSTVIAEGHLDDTRLLLHLINSHDGNEASYVINTTLIATSRMTFKWHNASNSTAGIYLTVQGMVPSAQSSRDRSARRTLEIKLTDATGVMLEDPKLNLY